MNGKPNTTVKVNAHDNTNELGREAGHLHKFLCKLREVGATQYDLVCMRTVNDRILEQFLGALRGTIPLPEQDWETVNLDRGWNINHLEPVIAPEDVSISKAISDIGLGIWTLECEGGGLILGDMKVAVYQPTGSCIVDGMYSRDRLDSPAPHYYDLNLAAARWLTGENFRAQGVFSGPPFSDEWANETLFFLGTVFLGNSLDKKYVLAPALTSNKKGLITLGLKPIPVGPWPEHCFAAVLVPR